MPDPADPSPGDQDSAGQDAESQAGTVRFGDFELDPSSGLLRDVQASDESSQRRLAPQPASLLLLLIEKRGALATRDEIRQRIWPDVAIDFDKSLHHCVRQVRAALGDRAADPRYIETIPRRGYRLKCEIHQSPSPSPPPESSPSPVDGPRDEPAREPAIAPRGQTGLAPAGPARVGPSRSGIAALIAVAAIGLVGIGLVVWVGFGGSEPLRIAIMPFDDPAMSDTTRAQATRVGEHLLAELTGALGAEADVVGPRATQPLRDEGWSLKEIAWETNTAYVINAKFVGTYEAPEILLELIRTSDGKHVWVRYYRGFDDWQPIAAEIIDGVTTTLAPQSDP